MSKIDFGNLPKYIDYDLLLRLRELCVWYRNYAKENNYRKGIYRELQQTPQWKEARQIRIKMARQVNHLRENAYLRCELCLTPTPEWAIIMHHIKYDWNYIFEIGIRLVCRKCHDNNLYHRILKERNKKKQRGNSK